MDKIDRDNLEKVPEPHYCREDAVYIARAVESFDVLLEACKLAFERLHPKGNVVKDYAGHVAMGALSKAIATAEEKA